MSENVTKGGHIRNRFSLESLIDLDHNGILGLSPILHKEEISLGYDDIYIHIYCILCNISLV